MSFKSQTQYHPVGDTLCACPLSELMPSEKGIILFNVYADDQVHINQKDAIELVAFLCHWLATQSSIICDSKKEQLQ